ncbi:MAG TPA: DUF3320 domain-containing protein [Longimicrobiales bacterium]|nr:DUF3320 domain-containing protein [Longimicrobiales bacterium]
MDPRIETAIEGWKSRLLDLSKRTRLLNFKVNRVATVTAVDELPVEVFRTLYVRRRAMRFAPRPEPLEPAAADAEEPSPDPVNDDVPDLPPVEFSPYEAAALADRYTDDVLQTNAVAEKLDRSLRRLHELAQTTVEEQGVNTLFLALGMLHYYEADSSDVRLKAPILLLPVQLERKSAKAAFTLRAGEDDPLINPALIEYMRRAFAIELPDLPEVTDDYDPQSLYVEVAEAVGRMPRWKVTNEVFLALFSFQKFVMYKDLERNKEAIGGHRLIQRLCLKSDAEASIGLPAEIASMDLDAEHPPESTFQVVDADASQLRAIAAVARGHDLVLEGPPGTGKSQTITNLIAHALSAGKRVLFVSEKMAALQVVYGRLKAVGLGDACLELHSQKANKRAVLQELRRTLDDTLSLGAPPDSSASRLQTVRGTLTEYAQAVHAPFGALGLSPFDGYGRLDAVAHAPRPKLALRVEAVTREELDRADQELRAVAAAADVLGDMAAHPWRDTSKTFYTADESDELRELLAELDGALRALVAVAEQVERVLRIPSARSFADAERAARIAVVVGRSPGAPPSVLASDAWNSAPPAAREIVERGRRLVRQRAEVLAVLAPSVLERDHADESRIVEQWHRRWYRMLSGDYRRVRKAWLADRLPGWRGTLGDQVARMREADAVRLDQEFLQREDGRARDLFAEHWNQDRSDWDALEAYIRWVVEFRAVCLEYGLRDDAIRTAAAAHPDVSVVDELRARAAEVSDKLTRLRGLVGWPDDYLAAARFEEILERLAAMAGAFDGLQRWCAFEAARARAAGTVAAEVVRLAAGGELAFADLPAAFAHAFFRKWLDRAVGERPALREFHSLTHEQRVKEFQELDRRILAENRKHLRRRLKDEVQERLREGDAASGVRFLQGQMARQRGHAPLRRTFQNAFAAIQAIKPCFMMSPLTVAQLLDAEKHRFDLVVFDEASQLPPEDTIGAIARGEQLVVVGDPKQLPPTNFFAVQTGQVEAPTDENGEPLFDDTESVLEAFLGAAVPTSRLRWHYRSQHESLIAFSNVSFYGDLHTFPSADTDTRSRGLRFEFVEGGVYEGSGLNLVEARRVADAVVAHIRRTPHLTLGIGTFNLRQQLAIQDELEARRRADPSLEPFFAPRDEGGFFVKNLENIQGDDRDVIFLSVTYGPGHDGRVRLNFGPINGENGWRRLNVLTTRARLRMTVFASMRGDDIDLSRTSSQGPRYLRDFLLFAERGILTGALAATGAEMESPFEREVFDELTRRGIRLQPQVGLAGYRVDFGVLDDIVEGRYVCGLECDGVAYHSAETARDRDRLRQQVLEGLGWTLHRIWSTDWFKDRQNQVARLLRLIEESRTKAREGFAAAPGEPANGVVGEPAGGTPGEFADGPVAEPASDVAAEPTGAASTTEPVVDLDPPTSPISPTSPTSPTSPPSPPSPPSPASPAAAPSTFAAPTRSGPPVPPHEALLADLGSAVLQVVAVEAPVHIADLSSRVAAAWGASRVGNRIAERIRNACEWLARQGKLELRGDFVRSTDGTVVVRSRANTGIPGEHIAPEELREAVATVLRASGPRLRDELVADVRALFGFARTGARLEACITEAIDAMLEAGILGEASTGLQLRG